MKFWGKINKFEIFRRHFEGKTKTAEDQNENRDESMSEGPFDTKAMNANAIGLVSHPYHFMHQLYPLAHLSGFQNFTRRG